MGKTNIYFIRTVDTRKEMSYIIRARHVGQIRDVKYSSINTTTTLLLVQHG